MRTVALVALMVAGVATPTRAQERRTRVLQDIISNVAIEVDADSGKGVLIVAMRVSDREMVSFYATPKRIAGWAKSARQALTRSADVGAGEVRTWKSDRLASDGARAWLQLERTILDGKEEVSFHFERGEKRIDMPIEAHSSAGVVGDIERAARYYAADAVTKER